MTPSSTPPQRNEFQLFVSADGFPGESLRAFVISDAARQYADGVHLSIARMLGQSTATLLHDLYLSAANDWRPHGLRLSVECLGPGIPAESELAEARVKDLIKGLRPDLVLSRHDDWWDRDWRRLRQACHDEGIGNALFCDPFPKREGTARLLRSHRQCLRSSNETGQSVMAWNGVWPERTPSGPAEYASDAEILQGIASFPFGTDKIAILRPDVINADNVAAHADVLARCRELMLGQPRG